MSPRNTPRTFWELYTKIQQDSVLTPEQEDTLRERAVEKYGMLGLLAKQKEEVTWNTKAELASLLSWVPEKDLILAKLDPLLPGIESTKVVQSQKPSEKPTLPKTTQAKVKPDIDWKDVAPDIAGTVAWVGAAVVGSWLVTEKWWKKALAEGFSSFRDWIWSFFDEDSMFWWLLGGMKEKIMAVFWKIGDTLGIKSAVASTREKTESALKSGSYALAANILTSTLMDNKEKLPLLNVLDYPLANISLNELKKTHQSKSYDTIYTKFDIKDARDKSAIQKICETLFDSPRVSKHIESAYYRNSWTTSVENTVTVKWYLSSAGRILKNFQYWASLIAGKTHDMLGIQVKDGELTWWGEFDPEGEKEQVDKLFSNNKEFNKKFLVYVLGTSAWWQYKIDTKNERLDQIKKWTASDIFKSEEEQALLQTESWKLFDFADRLADTILSNKDLNMGLDSDFRALFKSKGLTYRGLTLAYIALDGKTDYHNMTTIERAQMHSIVMWMCMSNDAGTTGAMLWRYTNAFRNSKSAIPQEVWSFMADIAKWWAEKTASGLYWVIKWLAGFAKEDPVIAATIIWLNAPIFWAKTSAAGILL